jgi:hypothetical protein
MHRHKSYFLGMCFNTESPHSNFTILLCLTLLYVVLKHTTSTVLRMTLD